MTNSTTTTRSDGDYIPTRGASAYWLYRDPKGLIVLAVERFDKPDGSKDSVPPRYCVKDDVTGEISWKWGNPYSKMFLYNLEAVHSNQHKPVLIVEGEKTAEAAKVIFSDDYWCTTFQGGCNGVKKAILKPLKGRDVYLLPDNDEAGRKAMLNLAKRTKAENLDCRIYMVDLPAAEFPKAWDVADKFPDGWDIEKLKTAIKEAPEWVDDGKAEANDKNETSVTMSLFPIIEPYKHEVNGKDLIYEISDTISSFVRMNGREVFPTAFWVLHTYMMDEVEITPRMIISSPEKRCGKSTLLNVLNVLSYNALVASSITAAALNRIVEAYRPTMLIDEGDTFINGNEALRGILNSGFECTGKTVKCDGDKHEPRIFSSFAAVAIASIGELPDTIVDRGICVDMARLSPSETVKSFRTKRLKDEFKLLQSKCLRFMSDNAEKISKIEPQEVPELGDRGNDTWEILFAIAELIGSDVAKELREIAIEIAKKNNGEDKESEKTLLLKDIKSIFEESKAEHIPSARLCEYLGSIEDRPWGEYSNGRLITTHKLGAMLKGFRIRTRQKNVAGDNRKSYFVVDFKDSFERYLPPTTD